MNLKIGDRIIDLSGYPGTIIGIGQHGDTQWYEVRFSSGVAVRSEQDVRLNRPATSTNPCNEITDTDNANR
jgi:hypothetical protein